MKDLILITTYCPDDYRENILRDLVDSLQSSPFDVMIVSHTPIPLDIQKKVNFVWYDEKNELLTDWDLLNQPWFNPGNDRRIQSSLLSKINTHLAIWRMLILGNSIAKNLGYKKVHKIEYDCIIKDYDEFIENSNLLDTHSCITYNKSGETVDDILFGSFISYNLKDLHPNFLILDEEAIKQKIRNSPTKSPELMAKELFHHKGDAVIKLKSILDQKENKFGIVDGQMGNNFIPWAVPFYDRLTNQLGFVVWNTKNKDGVKHQIIVNGDKMHDVPFTPYDSWRIEFIGNFDSIENLLILENNMVRDNINLKTQEEKEIFKKMSFRHKNGHAGDYG